MNNLTQRQEFLESLSDFKKGYLAELESRVTGLKTMYVPLLRLCGMKSAEEGFIEIENKLREPQSLSLLGSKIQEIGTLKHGTERDAYNMPTDHGPDSEASSLIAGLVDAFDSIIALLKQANARITEEAEIRVDRINVCPYGERKNRSKNAKEFERNVIELLSWLFIDEIRLLSRADLVEEQLKRDGVFEIHDEFNFVQRGMEGFRFSHIVVECKNYQNPSHLDLMQVHAYTFLNRIYPTVGRPLCLLVSRENPARVSVAWKMRNKLFEGARMGPLLVLFLCCSDLRLMTNHRKNFGDPFVVPKEYLRQMTRENISAEI